jgi:tyrosine-protein kinase Etk/Wzc
MAESTELLRHEGLMGAEKHPDDEVSLLEIATAIIRRRRIVGWTVLAALIIGILLCILLPTEYTAETTLLPPQQSSSLNSLLSSQLGGLAALSGVGHDLGLKNPNDMFVAMFHSQTVEDAMVKKYGLESEYHAKYLSVARKALESHSKVDGSSKDGLIHVTFTDHNPQRAAELANGYVDQFRHLSEHLAMTEAGQRRLFFQQQLEDAKNKLADAEEALKTTEEKGGLIQLDSQARALIESAAALRAQIAAKQVEIQGMRSYAADNNPNLVEAQQQLDALRSQLAQLTGNGGGADDELIVPRGKVPQAGLDYVRKYRDVKYYETIFDILARQFEVAKLDEAREGALIQVVDPAIVPDYKSAPKRSIILAISLLLGLFLGILGALASAGWENLNRDPVSRIQLDELRQAFRSKRARRG